MAHKGKVYPYFFARDLSLKPDGYTYLPEKWLWSGILGTGTRASQIVGKTFELVCTQGQDVYFGNIYWGGRINYGSGQFVAVGFHYGITHQANMAIVDHQIDFEGGRFVNGNVQDVTSAFPYNQGPKVWSNYLPSQFNMSYAGVFIPKPW